MNMHSEIYKRIRDNIIKTWPAWKRKIYNSCFAVSAHAEKLPEDNYTKSTPVWTNYDRLISKTPEELAEWISSNCTGDGYGNSTVEWLDWLTSPVAKEGKE